MEHIVFVTLLIVLANMMHFDALHSLVFTTSPPIQQPKSPNKLLSSESEWLAQACKPIYEPYQYWKCIVYTLFHIFMKT